MAIFMSDAAIERMRPFLITGMGLITFIAFCLLYLSFQFYNPVLWALGSTVTVIVSPLAGKLEES